MEETKLGKLECLIVSIIFLITSFVVIMDKLPNSDSDPYGTTVIAQNIIINHTLILKGAYADFFKVGGKLKHQVTRINNRIEYNYPLGTPILSIPFVVVANQVGLNALKQDRTLQKIIVFMIIFFVLLVTYIISRAFLSKLNSTIISVLAVFGTVIGPTIGTGLWSINFEVLFIGVTFLFLIKIRLSKSINSIMLGIILFLGYFVRPTFAIIIVFTFIYLAIRNRKSLVLVATTSFVFFALFVIFSLYSYGTYLPPYYHQGLSTINAYQALLGLLLSPSRSILIYSPIIILPILYSLTMFRSNTSIIYFIGILMMVSLFLINAFWPCWWGGWSYGPRILTDMVYISVILAIMIVGSAQQNRRKKMIVFMMLLFAIGVFINLPGMYNQYTRSWNAFPDIDKYPQACFDWRFPQFLTTSEEVLQKKCVTQNKEYGIKNEFPNYICPMPSIEYYQKYFSTLLSSSQKFIQDGNSLSDLLPQHLEKHGYLDKAFGYHTGPAKNWTGNSGWIGQWTCPDGKGKCFGIGIMGNINRLKPIIKKYQKFAVQVFFPYPKAYNPSTAKGSGELLIIFNLKFLEQLAFESGLRYG